MATAECWWRYVTYGLTLSLPENLCCWCSLSEEESRRGIRPSPIVHFVQLRFSWAFTRSQKSSRSSYDVLPADTKHVIKDVMWCHKGSERVKYDFIQVGKIQHEVNERTEKPRVCEWMSSRESIVMCWESNRTADKLNRKCIYVFKDVQPGMTKNGCNSNCITYFATFQTLVAWHQKYRQS